MRRMLGALLTVPLAIAAAFAPSSGADVPASTDLSPTDRLALIPDEILFSFDSADAQSEWITVNDNVMGGRSVGGFEMNAGRLVFTGSTNTNGGGFSSIRTRSEDFDLAGAEGMLYRVKGDGRTYIAALRNGVRAGRFDISYWATFETTGDWQTVRIPFGTFIPTFMGQDVSDRAPGLEASEVTGAAFYIYDQKDGPFSLEIEWIGTYAEDRQAVAVASELSATATQQPAVSREQASGWAMGVMLGAIERGVPQFNNGNPGACADLYELAIATLVSSPVELPADAAALLESGLRAGSRSRSHSDRAWAYRNAMDAALESLVPSGSAELSVRID